jgi:hypothetical protein
LTRRGAPGGAAAVRRRRALWRPQVLADVVVLGRVVSRPLKVTSKAFRGAFVRREALWIRVEVGDLRRRAVAVA